MKRKIYIHRKRTKRVIEKEKDRQIDRERERGREREREKEREERRKTKKLENMRDLGVCRQSGSK